MNHSTPQDAEALAAAKTLIEQHFEVDPEVAEPAVAPDCGGR